MKHNSNKNQLLIEAMEPRLLFSADLDGGLVSGSLAEHSALLSPALAEALDPAAASTEETRAASAIRQELVLVDTDTPDYQQLIDDLLANEDENRHLEVILLDNTRDGIHQVTEILSNYQGLDAVHLISHGEAGTVDLGGSRLEFDTLKTNANLIKSWGEAFSTDGDLLIYGCNLAATDDGQSLVNALGRLTGADVAASDDLTGSAELGGDWELEYTTGQVETNHAISAAAQQTWSGVLSTFTVSSTADSGAGSLRQAIVDANANANSGGPDVIAFDIGADGSQQTINLLSALDPISESVIIDGFSQYGALTPTVPIIEINGAGTTNADGLILAAGSDGSTIRGLVIIRFSGDGILIQSGADNITVAGNWIGTTGTGSTGDGNSDDGIDLRGANATIGGTGANDRNVITNSGDEGITIVGSGVTGHIIQGNYIGLDPDGSTGSGNADVGIAIISGTGNTIGGTTAAARNVISNNYEGIEINTSNNVVQGNYIGTDATGTADRGNRSDDGVEIQGGATGNLIGGTTSGAGNLIAYNALDGVNIVNGTGNSVLGNQIHSNSGLGIDLGPSGVSANDAGDGDTGANNLQNYPVLTSAASDGSTTITINGTLNTDSLNQDYRIEFFASTSADGTGYGEAERYLDFTTVTTDGSGNAVINTVLSVTVVAGEYITATATVDLGAGSYGDTSEFALNRVAVLADTNAPTLVNNTGSTVAEGGTDPITNTELRYDDDLQPATSVTYSITTSPVNGRLEFVSAPGAPITSFTQDDLDNNRVVFVHNGGETTSDSFNFDVNDGQGNILSAQSFAIIINPVNDAPVAVNDNYGLDFDGIDDYVAIADSASLTMTNTVTMEAWIKADPSVNVNRMIINKEGEYEVALFSDGTINWAFANTDPGWVWHNTGYVVPDGEWTHIAVTYDNGTVSTYVNGTLVDVYNGSGAIGDAHATLDELRIGGRSNNPAGKYFDGQIDEVRIWNTARTQAQVQAMMDQALTGGELGLAAYWNFNAGGGTSVTDLTANANTGTLIDGGAGTAGPQWTGYSTDQNTQINITAANGIVTNDIDGDGDALTVTQVNGNGANVGSLFTLPSGANLTVGVLGAFIYDPNGAFDYLDVGETAIDTFTYLIDDGNGGTDTATVSIVITGTEDAPVIGGTSTGAVTEDGTLTASDTLTITDVDTSDNPISFNDVAPTLGTNGYGNFEITGNAWTYTLNNAHAAVQALDVGETLNDTYTFTASDGSNTVVTITINGVEDAPVIGGVTTGTVTEDGTLAASDTLTITDVDTSDNPISFNDVAPTLGTNGYGNFEITGNTWTYTLNNSHAAVQALDAGEMLNDTYTFTATDGSTQVVTITINGAEDAPVIGGTATGSVAEDGTLTASDTLTITDVDINDNPISFTDVAPTLGTNGYGNFEITSGTWTYTLNNAHAAVQALDVGETLNDTYTFTATDGSTQVVTITINGAEDAPVIGGVTTGNVTEDGTLTASDTLTITDVDTSDNPISFDDVAPTLGGNGYGNFEITGNTWTYTLNNALATVQALDVGETLNDTYTFTATDGSTQVVTVTINGAEDAPVIGGVATGAVSEDGALTASDTLTITDVDTSDNPISFNDVATTLGGNGYGNFEITGNTWTYTLNNAHAAVQALDVGETLNDTYTFTATDGSTQVVTITINGAEDAPLIGGVDTGTVTEDVAVTAGNLTASGALTLSDVDTSDNPVSFTAGTIVGTYGDLIIDAAGNWSYSALNSEAAIQALGAGISVTDTLTVAANDGTTHDVTITLTGTNDVPVANNDGPVSVNAGGSVTINLAGNDIDIDNAIDLTSIIIVSGPANGTLVVINDGTVIYTHDGSATTSDSFTYTILDASGAVSGTATATLLVGPVDTTDPGSDPDPEETPIDDEEEEIVPETPPVDAGPAPAPVTAAVTLAQNEVSAVPVGEFTPEDSTDYTVDKVILVSQDNPGIIQRAAQGMIDKLEHFNHELWEVLENMKNEMSSHGNDDSRFQLFVKSATGMTLTLSIGAVSWAIRGTTLMASMLSSMPLWKGFDPLPLLAAKKISRIRDEDGNDELSEHDRMAEKRAAKLFNAETDENEDQGTDDA